MTGSVPAHNLTEKISLLLYPIYFEFYGPFFENWISISNFAYIATAKPDHLLKI